MTSFVFRFSSFVKKIPALGPLLTEGLKMCSHFSSQKVGAEERRSDIVNAVKLKPSEFTTGIQDVGTETDKTVIYNLAGQKMEKPQRGINLVNGRKVILK